jgi:hypothetical protein
MSENETTKTDRAESGRLYQTWKIPYGSNEEPENGNAGSLIGVKLERKCNFHNLRFPSIGGSLANQEMAAADDGANGRSGVEDFELALAHTKRTTIPSFLVTKVVIGGNNQQNMHVLFGDAAGNFSRCIQFFGILISLVPSSIPTMKTIPGHFESVLPEGKLPAWSANNKFALSKSPANKIKAFSKFVNVDPLNLQNSSDAARINSMFENAWKEKFGKNVKDFKPPLKEGFRFNQYDNSFTAQHHMLVKTSQDLHKKYKEKFPRELAEYEKQVDQLYASNKLLAEFCNPQSRYKRFFTVCMCENPNFLEDLIAILPNATAIGVFASTVSAMLNEAFADPDNVTDIALRFPDFIYGTDGKKLNVKDMIVLQQGQEFDSGNRCMVNVEYNVFFSGKGVSVSPDVKFIGIDYLNKVPVRIGREPDVVKEADDESLSKARASVSAWSKYTPAAIEGSSHLAIEGSGEEYDQAEMDRIETAIAEAESYAESAVTRDHTEGVTTAAQPESRKRKSDGPTGAEPVDKAAKK